MVVAVISPNREAQDVIAKALEQTGRVESVWSLLSYPEPSHLGDLPKQKDGGEGLVFLDFSDARKAVALALEARKVGAPIKIVALMKESGAEQDLARLGITLSIGLPPQPYEVLRVYTEHNPGSDVTSVNPGGGGRIFAFLPARPGAGATTIAVHTAATVAHLSAGKTLLIDFDFRLGMTSFLLRLAGQHSVIDALNDIERVDLRWTSLVNHVDNLDVLGSAPQALDESSLEQRTTTLLNFARQRYQTVVVDLPGEMRDYEIETLRQATSCLLVCNSDIGVMHMAQRKANQLRRMVLEDKTSVIMNRAGGLGMIAPREVESILGLPVRFTVSNAYKELAAAMRDANWLEPRGVHAQIESLARWMLPKDQIAAKSKEAGARRFLEFFTTEGARTESR